MTIEEITTWFEAIHARPAAPKKAAEGLNTCTSTTGTMMQWGRLYRSIEARFFNARRKQFSAQQMEALRDAADFGAAGGLTANSFPNLNRARIAFQMMARVIDPSLINQGPYQLCGPAAVVVSLARDHPVRYVQACSELADRGRSVIGQWIIQPGPEIRNNQSTQEADWVLCASVRNDDRAVTNTMYGTSGPAQIFEWLRGCGYRKAVMAVTFPLRTVRAEPGGLLPPGLSDADKDSLARTMASLTSKGWRVVMFAFGSMPTVTGAIAQADQMRLMMAGSPEQNIAVQTGRDHTVQQQINNLRTANPSLIKLAWRAITGNLAAHTMHATYVGSARVENNEITLNCVNFGGHERWVTMPLDAFTNKFVGFAAASDIG